MFSIIVFEIGNVVFFMDVLLVVIKFVLKVDLIELLIVIRRITLASGTVVPIVVHLYGLS